MKNFNKIIAFLGDLIAFFLFRNDLGIWETFSFRAIMFIIIGFSLGYLGANIGHIVREASKPDVIYYNRTSDYIRTQIKYSFGLNIMGAGFGFLATFLIIGIARNYFLLVILAILAIILSAISGSVFDEQNNNSDSQDIE